MKGWTCRAIGHRSAEELHWTVEALKLAFADAYRYVADPTGFPCPFGMIDKTDTAPRRELLRADGGPLTIRRPASPGGDTVYLCTADEEGRMVSFIQSNYLGFRVGCGDPQRASIFRTGATGSVGPRDILTVSSRASGPRHTIIPGFITGKDGVPLAAFGVMGGDMGPQGHTPGRNWVSSITACIPKRLWMRPGCGLCPEVPSRWNRASMPT